MVLKLSHKCILWEWIIFLLFHLCRLECSDKFSKKQSVLLCLTKLIFYNLDLPKEGSAYTSFFPLWPSQVACEIFIPRPGIEPVPPASEAWSFNPWTARGTLPFLWSRRTSTLPKYKIKGNDGPCFLVEGVH